jgi:(E)-4-hydroxy-3-methylbut-2-enyl-diphosphate synthase
MAVLTPTRRRTREVLVGGVGVGGDNPIRVQSMTTTRTSDTEATVAQTLRLVDAGCEIVRITAPTVADAKNLGAIKAELERRGVRVPLVADIHFSPAAALEAALHVDKVRINPGNFADSKTFATREYSDDQYSAELARIEERFKPVVLRCKERGIAMRIGTNHGSLSDRIMNRYGDTPLGMVESALEFMFICEKHAYFDVIFSMKSSNPKVMVQAYRLLAARLDALGKPYPFHLGVTEAGEGEDGRIKSAVGIGSLLEDGIGDTIRVSLTEDPEAEVPVAFALARRYPVPIAPEPLATDPFTYTRRPALPVRIGDQTIGGSESPRVFASVPLDGTGLAVARRLLVPVSKKLPKPDILTVSIGGDGDLSALVELRAGLTRAGLDAPIVARTASADLAARAVGLIDGLVVAPDGGETPAGVPTIVELRADSASALISAARGFAAERPDVPVLLVAPSSDLLEAAIALGSPLADGIGDAVEVPGNLLLAFNVLQAAGARVSKTDYVACPSCGRTLFDLQSTTARIKARTDHLMGVKLAIMGCVVNGPGEMADADFGYVGGAPGLVNLYVGKECVERGVPEADADLRLVELIKARGRWKEPEE